MARPSKLTEDVLYKLDEIADDGLTLTEVCQHIGIGLTTWRSWEATQPEDSAFRGLAARVRAGMGSATDELAWGTLRQVMEDQSARPGDRVSAATAVLRLRTPHRVEHSGPNGGPVTLASLALLAAQDADES
jgi:hypothetical protein